MTASHFFIVGAQRCGTTHLYRLLDDHPQICMSKPMRPEPKYFHHRTAADVDLDEYRMQFFNGCTQDDIVYGEKSTSYYEHESTAALISSSLPDARIIFLLRDPVQRAISNYFFSVQNGLETRDISEVFLEKDSKPPRHEIDVSVDPFNYLGRGEYARFISTYSRYFSDDRIKVLTIEKLAADDNELASVYSYLGVDDNFTRGITDDKTNAAVRNMDVPDAVLNYLKDYYANPNRQLREMLDLDISRWN